jgi:hypothetical protein
MLSEGEVVASDDASQLSSDIGMNLASLLSSNMRLVVASEGISLFSSDMWLVAASEGISLLSFRHEAPNSA